MSTKALLPKVEWAQRSNETDPEKNYILLTISITDCEDPILDIQPTYLDLTAKSKGHVGDEIVHEYKLHIDFFKEIVPDKTLHKKANGQHYFLKIFKKDLQLEYWPRLTKEKVKYNNIKTDFDKWVDEDEQDEVPANEEIPGMDALGAGAGAGMGGAGGMDFAEMMKGMGGAGAGAGGAPGGMDFSQMLQGMGGAGAGAGGMGGANLQDMLSGDKAKQFEELMKQMQAQDATEGAGHDHEHDHEHDHDHDHDHDHEHHHEEEEKDAEEKVEEIN